MAWAITLVSSRCRRQRLDDARVGDYTREQLVRMDADFVAAMERAP
jgi:hypothetical protein